MTSKLGGGYRLQKLPGADHTALCDALDTFRLIEGMPAGRRRLSAWRVFLRAGAGRAG